MKASGLAGEGIAAAIKKSAQEAVDGAKKAAEAVQGRAFEFLPYVPTAQFILPTAYRTNLSGIIVAPMAFLWNVEKK